MRQPNILDYLPEVFKNIKEIQAIAIAENPELEKLWNSIENAYNDQFLYTMTENGIKRWEKILGISTMGTDTLEDRRFRIINRLNPRLPYTFKMLEEHLIQMCGSNGYTMQYDETSWTLTIKIALTSKKQFDDVLQLVKEMIPMNIILDYDLLYNQYELYNSYTYGELASYTCGSLKEDVILMKGLKL